MDPHNESVEPAELGLNRLLLVFAALAIVLLVLLALAPLRSHFTEWRAVQGRYDAQAKKAGVETIPIGLRQIWKPELSVTDRCGSCHLASDGAAPIAGDPLFQAHPPIPHEPREFGCTVCHGGQGRATTAAAAHGNVPHWDEPILARPYFEAGCGTCHSHLKVAAAGVSEKGKALIDGNKCGDCHHIEAGEPNSVKKKLAAPDLSIAGVKGFRPDWHAKHVEQSMAAKEGVWTTSFSPLADEEVLAVDGYLRTLVGAPRLMEAKTLAHRRGCRGCHKIGGVGGDDGPDLSDEGRRKVSDLDYAQVAGGRDLPSWLKAHFLDPPKVVRGSKMPRLGFSDADADLLTLYMLSLRTRTIPEALAPRDRVRGLRLGERDFATDGASLFGVFCAACHGPRGEGRKFETLEETFPAIGSAAFLVLADDAFLRRTLLDGRPGRRMPAWGKKAGGLRSEEMDAVVSYLRSLEPVAPTLEAVLAAPADAETGRRLFATACAPCHGAAGEGSAIGPPIAAADDPVTTEDSRIYGTLAFGVAGTAMGSFRDLSAAELHAVIATVRALPHVAAQRAGWAPQHGDPKRGAAVYDSQCAKCHGSRGEGQTGPALSNAAFLGAATDGYLTATIIRGRGKTAMPHFGETNQDHPLLSPDEVAAVIAWLRAPH